MFETFYVGPSSQAFSTGSSGIAWFAGYVSKNKSHKVRHVDDGYEEVLNLFNEWAWYIVKQLQAMLVHNGFATCRGGQHIDGGGLDKGKTLARPGTGYAQR